MNTTTYKFGTSNIPLKYSGEELEAKVKLAIESMAANFTFSQLCRYIIDNAYAEGKLQIEPNTEYSTIHLTIADINKISLILWQYIWDRKVIISFEAYPQYHQHSDLHFLQVNEIHLK